MVPFGTAVARHRFGSSRLDAALGLDESALVPSILGPVHSSTSIRLRCRATAKQIRREADALQKARDACVNLIRGERAERRSTFAKATADKKGAKREKPKARMPLHSPNALALDFGFAAANLRYCSDFGL